MKNSKIQSGLHNRVVSCRTPNKNNKSVKSGLHNRVVSCRTPNKNDKAVRSMVIVPVIMLLLCMSSLNAKLKNVEGFPEIPVYPGADILLDKQRSGDTDEDGHPWVWYEFRSDKLKDEWNNDPVKTMDRIINFYKIKLKRPGWQYIGEGVQRHHWVKEKQGIAIGFAENVITYTRMSNWDARTNVTKMREKEFMRVYVDCAKAAQKIYERHGMKTGNEYAKKMLDAGKKNPQEAGKFESKIKNEVKKAVKDRLRMFRVSPGRFKELKSEYGEAFQQYITDHSNDYVQNQVGFMALDQLDTSSSVPYNMGTLIPNK